MWTLVLPSLWVWIEILAKKKHNCCTSEKKSFQKDVQCELNCRVHQHYKITWNYAVIKKCVKQIKNISYFEILTLFLMMICTLWSSSQPAS